jgi:hypothetical protein
VAGFPRSQRRFLRAFTVHAAAKPVEPVSEPVEPVLVRLTSRRLLLFLLPFLLSLFTLSFVTAVVAFTFPLSLSHTLTPHSKSPSSHQILEEFIGDLFLSASSINSFPFVGISVVESSDRGIALFSHVFTRSNTVLDCLVYLFKDTM